MSHAGIVRRAGAGRYRGAIHPFGTRDRGWVPARDLRDGDEVFTSRGGWLRVGTGTWVESERVVWNLTVEGTETYFVGESGAWVHNLPCPPVVAGEAGRFASLDACGGRRRVRDLLAYYRTNFPALMGR